MGARSSSLRRPGAEEPGQAASCRGGPPRRLAREPTVRFAKPLPAPRAVVPAPKPPARFGNEISFLVSSAAHPVNVTLDGGPQRVSPSASVSPSVKWGQKLRGAPLAGLREQEGADGRRRAGGRAIHLSGQGRAVGLGSGAGREGRASVPSTPDPTSSPKSPLQGSGKEGVGPAPAPDGVQLALGGAPRFPRGPQTQAGLTHGARDLGVVHPAPHITQRVGARTARVGGQATEASVLPRGTRQVSPQLPALRGGASGSPGGGGEGPSGRDLGSSGVFIRLKLPAGC